MAHSAIVEVHVPSRCPRRRTAVQDGRITQAVRDRRQSVFKVSRASDKQGEKA